MKITRLKRGYVIRLSDGEFEALQLLVEHGQADMSGADDFDVDLSSAGQRALRSGRFCLTIGSAMDVDEDRRK